VALTMVTRQQALAASSPYLWVLAGQAVFLGVVFVGWNVYVNRDAILDRAAQLVRM
jgi:hypothetical protein